MKKLGIFTTLLFALGLCMVPASFSADSTDSKNKQSRQDQYQKDQKGQTQAQQKHNLMLVDSLIGAEVQNQQGEKIGDIDKILVDVENGQISFVTVASGGVLGVGDDKYIVPFKALQRKMTQDNKAQTGAGQVVFTLNKNKDQLKKVPQGDIEEAFTQEGQSKGIYEFYGVSPYWEGNQRQDTQHKNQQKY